MGRNLFADAPIATDGKTIGRSLFKNSVNVEQDVDEAEPIEPIALDTTPEVSRMPIHMQRQLLGLSPSKIAFEKDEDIQVNRETPWLDVLAQGMSNVPSSGKKLFLDTLNAFRHPIETGRAVGGAAVGAAQKLIPGEQPQERHIDLMIDFYKDRYGSLDGFKKAVAEDPVGVFADASTFLVPGGAVLQGVGKGTKISMLSKIGKAASKTGVVYDPFNVAKATAKVGAGATTKAASKFLPMLEPSDLYRRAVKFSTTIPAKTQNKLIASALKHDILPTANGMDRLRSKINVLNKQIEDAIVTEGKTGRKINYGEFLQYTDKLKKFEKSVFGSDSRAIENVVKDFHKQQVLKRGSTQIPIEEAHKIKQELYSRMEKAYSKLNSKPIKTETQMAIASGIRQSLEDVIPEIRQLNADEASLINLRKAIEGRVASIKNADVVPFSLVGRSLIGGALGGQAGAVGGLTFGLMSAPVIKSKIALVLKDLQSKGIQYKPTQTAIRLGLVLPERAKGEDNE